MSASISSLYKKTINCICNCIFSVNYLFPKFSLKTLDIIVIVIKLIIDINEYAVQIKGAIAILQVSVFHLILII